MRRITVKGPDGRVEHSVELEPQSGILLGRAPNPQVGERALENATARLRVAQVLAPSVSANHLLAWRDADELCVKDLGSKNGTWLLLPPERAVRCEADEVQLHLARSSSTAAEGDEPDAPSWTSKFDFARGLASCVHGWLASRGLEVAVNVVDIAPDEVMPPNWVPLATGEALEVVPLVTADASWSRQLELVFRWAARQNALYEAERQTRDEGMILASAAIREAHREVLTSAQTGARTLLLIGPSGAGKERLAEVFHRHSRRAGPFVAVNCGMFSKELLRSELFGAEAGTFTDAKRRILGAVERAEGGTLFLDEIGELSSEVQPMLLRFLDSREYQRLGQYGRAQRADVLVVAATNRDLREAARTGEFRADLWYRLSVHVVDVPPLRTRWDDIAAHLRSVRLDGAAPSLYDALSSAALDVLRAHAWEGNFRELNNFTARMARGAGPSSIDAALCRRELERGSLRPIPRTPQPDGGSAAEPGWERVVRRAIQAFVEDHDREPASWDDQKEWNEKYLKPLLFFQLSGAASAPMPLSDDELSALASRAATRVHADRGTALKQLARYFERFARGGAGDEGSDPRTRSQS